MQIQDIFLIFILNWLFCYSQSTFTQFASEFINVKFQLDTVRTQSLPMRIHFPSSFAVLFSCNTSGKQLGRSILCTINLVISTIKSLLILVVPFAWLKESPRFSIQAYQERFYGHILINGSIIFLFLCFFFYSRTNPVSRVCYQTRWRSLPTAIICNRLGFLYSEDNNSLRIYGV